MLRMTTRSDKQSGAVEGEEEEEEEEKEEEANTQGSKPLDQTMASADGQDENLEILPEGWQRVRHESGLHCFFHAPSSVVSWVQPYAITSVAAFVDDSHRDAVDDQEDEDGALTFVKKHVPPRGIFALPRGQKGSNGSDGDSRATNKEKNDQAKKSRKRRRVGEETELQLAQYTRRRQLPTPTEAQAIVFEENEPAQESPGLDDQTTAQQPRLVTVNGLKLQDPTEKSPNAFLTEYVMKSMRCVPQYFISKARDEDRKNPICCVVKIRDREYANVRCASKTVAKQVAAEAVLDHLLPGFWQKVKQSRGGKDAINPNSPVKQQDHNKDRNGDEEESGSFSVSFDKFKSFSIDDSRVLQACMEHCFKTPAQVLQEYQNRNRGISVNYNTVPIERNGKNVFKTIASAGSAVGEGIATTKKCAKQFAAQSLLAILHQHTTTTYHQLANMYSHGAKSNTTPVESYSRSAGVSSREKPYNQSSGLLGAVPPTASGPPSQSPSHWYPQSSVFDQQPRYGAFGAGYSMSAPQQAWSSPYPNQYNYPGRENSYSGGGYSPWYPDAARVQYQEDASHPS